MTIDYNEAKKLLDNAYKEVSKPLSAAVIKYIKDNKQFLDKVFSSNSKSYREVLLGCAIAKYLGMKCNIRHPYIGQGDNAFNGRTLDEQVINPFLVAKQIPCSKGPYLAVFRRKVTLTDDIRGGLRDKEGYDALLNLLSTLEAAKKQKDVKTIIIAILKQFVDVREKSQVRLIPIQRLTIAQYRSFLNKMQKQKSGGLIPMLLTDAIFSTINSQLNRDWSIERQGINAADGVTGAPGDITIYKDGAIFKAIEVTERPIDDRRIDSTFATKIAINNATEYLFIYTNDKPKESAILRAKAYFAQGYNIAFASITELTIHILIAEDKVFQTAYNKRMLELFSEQTVPAAIKMAWNDALTETMEL